MIPAHHRPIALLLARLYWAESDALHFADPATLPDYAAAQARARELHDAGNAWLDVVMSGLTEAEQTAAWAAE